MHGYIIVKWVQYQRHQVHVWYFIINVSVLLSSLPSSPISFCTKDKRHTQSATDQHCVDTLMNTSNKTVERKILCFFLVDPTHRVISTQHIGDQNWDRCYRYLAMPLSSILPLAGTTFLHIPQPVVGHSLTHVMIV
jgi:hypothetical protein